ncbi:hypothetical protein [Enterococcus timonensis]|uniref:hypothetical protein n=1 Tax=Enterococcus timonensis TaxID=1852364 RepID=UPI00131A3970|nr:hypothetical protein [Enterococcus timonensis]
MEKVRYAMFVFIELKKIKIKKETDKKVNWVTLSSESHTTTMCSRSSHGNYVSGWKPLM